MRSPMRSPIPTLAPMDESAARTAVSDAAAAFGRLAAPPDLVAWRENAVFSARLDDGRRVALRLHRPGYQSPAAIEEELRWTEALADAGFACPWPQRTRDGALLVEGGRGAVSVVQWIEGRPFAAAGTAPPAPERFHALGALIADLHLTCDAVAPPLVARPVWDAAAFCDPQAPLWGRYWDNPALSAAERDLLCAARREAAVRLAALPGQAWGPIHADILGDNVLEADGLMHLIDFDDGGPGFRQYDLATALVAHAEAPAYADLRAALVAGYAAAGGPLADPGGETLELFVALRAMASCGWIVARAPADDPRQRRYAARAAILARRMLG